MARLAIIGAGWAGLASAVHATLRGHTVALFEMAAAPGGRARSVFHDAEVLDNGQHILIGAYRETLALMRQVGVDPERVLHRQPLAMVDARGHGLALRPGPAPLPSCARCGPTRAGRCATGWPCCRLAQAGLRHAFELPPAQRYRPCAATCRPLCVASSSNRCAWRP